MNEYILCAAIHYDDGREYKQQPKNIKTGYVVSGRRHDNCIALHKLLTDVPTRSHNIQGFITSRDRFLNREEAAKVAFAAKQIEKLNDCLISEDLY